MDSERAVATIDALGTEIAVLDRDGRVLWVSAAWEEATQALHHPLAGAGVDMNLVGLLRGMTDRGGDQLAAGVAAVARGTVAGAVGELRAAVGSAHSLLVARPLPPPRLGAVVTRSDPGNWYPRNVPAAPDPGNLSETIADLSPRELEVLRLMTQGLDNRQIAGELGIAYTTVRSHTRSLIDKLGARSRLDAVARAYRAGVGGAR
jgi:DNA-binding CsgD family transcriptional regulator